MQINYLKIILFGLLLTSGAAYAQNDSIVFKNGNFIVGEIKGMNRGVLTVETDYSDDDFTIEWEGIKAIYSDMYYLFTISDGRRFNGSFKSTENGIIIYDAELGSITVSLNDIVYIKSVKQDFWSKLSASIDVGYSFTKARNNQQFNARSNIGYITDHWSIDASYNALYTIQDSVDAIRRFEGAVGFNYFLKKGWFLMAQTTSLTNTEQSLKLRGTGKLGAGYYLLHTNNAYWNVAIGGAYLNEEFYTDDPTQNSMEAFLGSQVNLFDIGDLNLVSELAIYEGLTETGRFRCDFQLDVKYDLPRDFYVKVGTTVNYDNKPATGSSEADYVLQAGFGWEL